MESENYIYIEDLKFNIDSLNIIRLSKEENEVFKFFSVANRNIQEIEKLFNIYRCNLNIMLESIAIKSTDEIIVKKTYSQSEYILVNTLLVNLISSGKTLIETIEKFTNCIDEKEKSEIKFKYNWISKIYDTSFAYRFLIFLRNYSQHGNIPVSNDYGNQYCFSLDKILNTKSFNFNKNIKDEMEGLRIEVYNKFHEYPNLSFSNTIINYNYCIHLLYFNYYKSIRKVIYNMFKEVKCITKENPNLIHHETKELDNKIVFYDEENNIHVYPNDDGFLKTFDEYKHEARIFLQKEEIEKNRMCKKFNVRNLE